jgi:hypothetical protein
MNKMQRREGMKKTLPIMVKFEHAPSIRKDQWNRLEDPAFEKEVFSYYGERMPR